MSRFGAAMSVRVDQIRQTQSSSTWTFMHAISACIYALYLYCILPLLLTLLNATGFGVTAGGGFLSLANVVGFGLTSGFNFDGMTGLLSG
jgi:hypothetical protein